MPPLRDRVTLYDQLLIDSYARLAVGKDVKKYLRKILGLLITCKPRFWHLRHLNAVLDAHGLIKKDDDLPLQDTVKNTLNRIGAHYGARLHKSPYEVLTGHTGDELAAIDNALTMREVESIQHNWLSSQGTGESLTKYVDKLKSRLTRSQLTVHKGGKEDYDYSNRKALTSAWFGN